MLFCSTFRQDCPAHIALKISSDGAALQVRSVNEDHNHEISKVCMNVSMECLSIHTYKILHRVFFFHFGGKGGSE